LNRYILLALGSAVLLSGCSDPKKASKGNFQAAIGHWIEKNPPCLTVPQGEIKPAKDSDAEYPRYVDASPLTAKFAIENRERQEAPFAALVDAGLMTVRDARISIRAGLFDDTEKEVPVHAYELSAEGKKAIATTPAASGLKSMSQRFCNGTPTIAEVVQFTEPAEMMGVKISQVSYRHHLENLPAWTQNAKLRAAYPQLERDTGKSLDGKAAVVLTNESWVHEKESGL